MCDNNDIRNNIVVYRTVIYFITIFYLQPRRTEIAYTTRRSILNLPKILLFIFYISYRLENITIVRVSTEKIKIRSTNNNNFQYVRRRELHRKK